MLNLLDLYILNTPSLLLCGGALPGAALGEVGLGQSPLSVHHGVYLIALPGGTAGGQKARLFLPDGVQGHIRVIAVGGAGGVGGAGAIGGGVPDDEIVTGPGGDG